MASSRSHGGTGVKFLTSDDRSWPNAFRAIRSVPADFIAVAAFVVFVDIVVLVVPFQETILRPLLALPLLFFVPGYALLAALFPARHDAHTTDGLTGVERTSGAQQIAWVERLALSFGASIVLLPILGVVLAVAGLPMTASTVVLSLGVFAVLGMAVGTVRRWQLPPEARFRVPYERWVERGRASVTGSRRDVLVNLVLALSIVLAAGGFAYALAAPNDGSAYTEFVLLSEDDDGELVTSGYPEDVTVGEPTELVLGLENYEGETVEYTVVVVLERVDTVGEEVTVVESERVGHVTTTVEPGETVHERYAVEPSMTGEDLRLSYYLYQDDPPAEPSSESAAEHLFIWIDVSGED